MRISGIEEYLGGADNVSVIELIKGEQRVFTGTITDNAGQPLNLSSFTLTSSVEFGTVDATVRGNNITVTNWSVTPGDQPATDPTITLATTSNVGEIQLVLPSDLEHRDPVVDASTDIPIAIITLTYNDGGSPATIRKSRMVAITRYGS